MRTDPLFLGPTLPNLFFGAPYDALAVGFALDLIGCLTFGTFVPLLLLVPYYGLLRLVAQEQPRICQFIHLWMATKLGPLAIAKVTRRKSIQLTSFSPRRY